MPSRARPRYEGKPAVVSVKSGSTSSVVTDLSACQFDGSAASSVRHYRLPKNAPSEELELEVVLLVYSLCAMLCQYLHLYQTTWWLRFSQEKHAIRLSSVDWHMTLFIATIVATRLVRTVLQRLLQPWNHSGTLVASVLSYSLIFISGCVSLFQVRRGYPPVKMLALFAPVFVIPLLQRLLAFCFHRQPQPSRCIRFEHVCSMEPEKVRDEITVLNSDVQYRLLEAVQQSFLAAFYTTFLPYLFAREHHGSRVWLFSVVILVWCSTFLFHTMHLLPLRYLDVLHRAAQHLGAWKPTRSRAGAENSLAWSEFCVYERGTTVRHPLGAFVADGNSNAAIPGNKVHQQFSNWFAQPLKVLDCLLLLDVLLIAAQMTLLMASCEWSRVLSLGILLFANFYAGYKLMRDRFFVCHIHASNLFAEVVRTG